MLISVLAMSIYGIREIESKLEIFRANWRNG